MLQGNWDLLRNRQRKVGGPQYSFCPQFLLSHCEVLVVAPEIEK